MAETESESTNEIEGEDASPVVGGVLAAGLGTRMRPLTESVPKPLLPFLNTPLVTYPLQHLADAGLQRVGFNLHHLADSVPPVIDPIAARLGLDPSYAREWERLGTAGGIASIWKSLDQPAGATLVVFNGDTVMNLDLREHIRRHRESDALVTLVGTSPDAGRPANLKLDADAQLAGIRDARRPDVGESVDEEGLDDCAFAGVHILSAEAVGRLETQPGDVVEELYEPLVEAGAAIQVSRREGFWSSLETPEMLMSVTREVLRSPDRFEQAPMPPSDDGIFVLDESFEAEDVEIQGPVFIGHHADVGPGAKIGPNAVLDGVTVMPEVEVREAVVYGTGSIENDHIGCIAVADQIVALDSADETSVDQESEATTADSSDEDGDANREAVTDEANQDGE